MCAGFALDIPLSREALVVPAASRVRCAVILTRSVLGLRPVLRVRPPVTPLTRFSLQGGISEFGKNRTLSEQVATRDAIVKHFVIYGIVLILD